MSIYKIGLFGYGCVGQGFVELLQKASHLNAKVVKVCVKHPGKQRSHVPGQLVYDPDAILNDEHIDLIVELIDDAEAALAIVKKALVKGKHVVSANKKMIAENLELLQQWQSASTGRLLYEGAVCGSIPVLSALRNYYQHDGVHTINGIFNGSTNYILTKVIDEKLTYKEALYEAQENGFAESNPALDVEGFDASFKLSILVQHVFNSYIKPEDILRVGIQQITADDVRFARENNLKIKLIAHAALVNHKIEAWVAPQFISNTHPLSDIKYEYNAVKLSSESFGEQIISGKGAGKLPTGLAVLSDVGAILHNNVNSPLKNMQPLVLNNDTEVEVYVSYQPGTEIDWSLFNKISEKWAGRKNGYMVGKMTIEKIKCLSERHPEVSIILTSGEQLENSLNRLTYKNEEAELAKAI